MAEVVYNTGKSALANGRIANGATNLKAVNVITSKSGADNPDLATMAAIDGVGTVGLHSERVTLTSVTVTTDNTNDRANIDCANITFAAAAGVTSLGLIIYDATTDTSDTTRVPIAFYDTGWGAGLPMDGGLVVTVNDFLRNA
jgi:hypothetical protein